MTVGYPYSIIINSVWCVTLKVVLLYSLMVLLVYSYITILLLQIIVIKRKPKCVAIFHVHIEKPEWLRKLFVKLFKKYEGKLDKTVITTNDTLVLHLII